MKVKSKKFNNSKGPYLHSLNSKSELRLQRPASLISRARLKTALLQSTGQDYSISTPLVLSAKNTYDNIILGAFLSFENVLEFNSGSPIVEFPYSFTSNSTNQGRVIVNLLNRPNTGYALQFRVYSEVFSKGKFHIDSYTADYFSPTEKYELDILEGQQSIGFYVIPPSTNLLWLSLHLYPAFDIGGRWGLYDVTINQIS